MSGRRSGSGNRAVTRIPTAMTRRQLGRAALATLILMNAAKLAHWLRRIDLRTGLPIVNAEYLEYYARALRAHEFLARSQRLWGFDPFSMAGSPAGFFNEAG